MNGLIYDYLSRGTDTDFWIGTAITIGVFLLVIVEKALRTETGAC